MTAASRFDQVSSDSFTDRHQHSTIDSETRSSEHLGKSNARQEASFVSDDFEANSDLNTASMAAKSHSNISNWHQPAGQRRRAKTLREDASYGVDFNSTPGIAEYKDFEQMPCITEDIWKGICAYGLRKPSIIQSKAIMPIFQGKDTIVQAQSGAGKTICFSLGILSRLEIKQNNTQAIILSPTRELAQQTRNVIAALGDYLNVSTHYCAGQTNYSDDIQKCQAGFHVISGTPGRLLDMLSQGYIDVTNLKMFVLDEADSLLDTGFKEDIYEVYRRLPPSTQTVCVSATFPYSVLEMTSKFMNNPVKVLKMRDELAVETITNYFISLECEEWKFDTLCDLFDTIEGLSLCIVYVNSKEKAEWLKRKMFEKNFSVAMVSSDLEQRERDELLKQFRLGKYRLMIATDLMSRGIDINNLSLVINYEVPKHCETYLHRIGRSGRFGKRGIAINLVTPLEYKRLMDIGHIYNIVMNEMAANIQDLVS